MNKYLRLHTNWRFNVICVIAAAALLLLACEADSTAILLATKVAGLALTFFDISLSTRWHRAGKLPEVDEAIGEDE